MNRNLLCLVSIVFIVVLSCRTKPQLREEAPSTVSLLDTVYHWNIASKKIGDGKYELNLSTNGSPGWQLYSPSQVLPDFKTTELIFADSSIKNEKGIKESGVVKEFRDRK